MSQLTETLLDLVTSDLRRETNRRIIAEVECETAMELLCHSDLMNCDLWDQARMLRAVVNRAHEIIDASGAIPLQATSHRGLCSRVLQIVLACKGANVTIKGPEYELKQMSLGGLTILAKAYRREGAPVPPEVEIALEEKQRESR